jgi:hypothetical protein
LTRLFGITFEFVNTNVIAVQLFSFVTEYAKFEKVRHTTDFGLITPVLLAFHPMFALAALLSLVSQVSGTPYVSGGDTPAGTDCSGLASWVANVASGRPAFGSRFNTGNMESALLARGFHYGTAPNSVVIGWNSGHAAVTLPDGTPVSSGEGGAGVRVGGGGAYQSQFSRHMFLPVQARELQPEAPAAVDPLAAPPTPVDLTAPETAPVEPMPAPEVLPVEAAPAPEVAPVEAVPAPDVVPVPDPAAVPADQGLIVFSPT